MKKEQQILLTLFWLDEDETLPLVEWTVADGGKHNTLTGSVYDGGNLAGLYEKALQEAQDAYDRNTFGDAS